MSFARNTCDTLSAFASTVATKSIKALAVILSVCSMPPAITHTRLQRVLGTNNTTMNVQDMVGACSRGKLNFVTEVVPVTVRVPCNSYNERFNQLECKTDDWANYTDTYLQDTLKYNLDDFYTRIYILPKGDLCGFGGLGLLGPCDKTKPCRMWISGNIPDKVTVYFHELGHNLGLHHASHMHDQYGDLTDAMGYCCNVRCFSAPNTFKLEWDVPTHLITTPIMQHHNIRLRPYEYVMIEDKARMERTFIQYRIANGGEYDKDIDSTAINIYVVPTHSPYGYSNLAAIISSRGQTWQSVHSALVTLQESQKDYAQIRIEPNLMSKMMESSRIPV